MEDRVDLPEAAPLQARQEIVLVEVVGDVAADEIHELPAVRHVVDDDHVVVPATVQLADDVAANEAGAAGDYDHGGER